MKPLFDPVQALTQYFICPHDYFALSSLEILDSDEYIYRLLREDGYERVIFIDIEDNKCISYTYDRFSRYSYHQTAAFEAASFSSDPQKRQEDILRFIASVTTPAPTKASDAAPAPAPAPMSRIPGRHSLLSGGSRRTPAAAAPAPAPADAPFYGKQFIMNTSVKTADGNGAQFSSHFNRYIEAALRTEKSKTAIVMPVKIFEKDGFSSEEVADYLHTLNKKNNQKNLLLLTADTQDDLACCFNDRSGRIHNWVNAALEEENRPDPADLAVKILCQRRRLVVATPAEPDEIANLIFHWKLVKQDPRFSSIPVGKIYHLASLLWEDFTEKTKNKPHFKSFSCNNNRIIQSLNSYFEDRTHGLLDEINELLPELKVRSPRALAQGSLNASKSSNAIYLDRLQCPKESESGNYYFAQLLDDVSRYQVSVSELNSISKRLDEMIGLDNVKQIIRQKQNIARTQKKSDGPGHYMFVGNPGTGKTVVARLMGEIFHAYGLLSKGHFVEAKRADLISDCNGQTAIKTRAICEKALGGVLLVDEAHQLVNTDPESAEKFPDSYSKEAYNEIMTYMENNRSNICVIFTGYDREMDCFKNADPGMASRNLTKIQFPDYTADELLEILKFMARNDSYLLTDGYLENAKKYIDYLVARKTKGFANARTIRTRVLETSKVMVANRLAERSPDGYVEFTEEERSTLLAEDAPNVPTLDEDAYREAMAALDEMIGLQNVKKEVRSLRNRSIIRRLSASKKAHVDAPGHFVFLGNPGTGKTEVARLMGKIFKALGVLEIGHCVEAKKTDLVAGYVGQSSIKARSKCEAALGGVLLVDEAYELVNTHADHKENPYPDDFCREAYTEIMTFMEDNRNDICVIFTGYERQMEIFCDANPGMASRNLQKIHFPDYNVDELEQIFSLMAAKNDYVLTDEFHNALRRRLAQMCSRKSDNFGNARAMRTLVESCYDCHVERLNNLLENGATEDDIRLLTNRFTAEDIPNVNEVSDSEPKAKPSVHYKRIPGSLFRPLPQTMPPTDSNSLKNSSDPAVLFIETDRGCGTGFLIHPSGYALTCNHVIENASQISARLYIKGRMGGPISNHDCQVINTRTDMDIALIKLEGSDFPYLPLAPVDFVPEWNHKFILSGYPFGKRTVEDLTTYTGYIASTTAQTDEFGCERIFFGGEAKRGNSGSPLISQEHGCVIGLLVGSLREEHEEINYFRPIHYFWKEFLS